MAKIKKISWSLKAVENLEDIATYISKNSSLYAPIFIQKIISSVDALMDFPLMGRKVPEFNNDRIREIIFQNYRIVYRVNRNNVEIILVTHGAKLLK